MKSLFLVVCRRSSFFIIINLNESTAIYTLHHKFGENPIWLLFSLTGRAATTAAEAQKVQTGS
jgi:hypothetical protein